MRQCRFPHRVVKDYRKAGKLDAVPSGPRGFAPADIRKLYGFDQISANGAGETIGIIIYGGDFGNIETDLAFFDSYFSLPAPPSFRRVDQRGGTSYPASDSASTIEMSLDLQWSHAMAPGANIVLVECDSSASFNIFAGIQTAINLGATVISMSFGYNEFGSSEISEDAALPNGVSYSVASGDSAILQWPATSPKCLAVGGTLVTADVNGNWASETAWNQSGGGLSPYEPQPSYQNGVVTQSSTQRGNPDVSFVGGQAFSVRDTDPFYNNILNWVGVYGTSAGTPIWAAIIAIANQLRVAGGKSRLDFTTLLPFIYSMPASNFHDITTGGTTSFSAGPGYDLVTGRGTPLVNLVVPALVGPATGTLPMGTWVQTTNPSPNSANFLPVVMTDGTILLCSCAGVSTPSNPGSWAKLTPTSDGNYVNGTWTTIANSHYVRQFFGSVILPSGKLWICGGEDSSAPTGNQSNTGEIYDPVANSWSDIAPHPAGQGHVGDSPCQILPNGTIMMGSHEANSPPAIYNPSNNTWSAGPPMNLSPVGDGGQTTGEAPLSLLPDNTVINVNVYASISALRSEVYHPTTNNWSLNADASFNLVNQSVAFEIGPTCLLPDQRLLCFGVNGVMGFFNNTTKTWTQASIINGLGNDDGPAVMMPNGNVLICLNVVSFVEILNTTPVIYEFDPVNIVWADVTPAIFTKHFFQITNAVNGGVYGITINGVTTTYTANGTDTTTTIASSLRTNMAAAFPSATWTAGGAFVTGVVNSDGQGYPFATAVPFTSSGATMADTCQTTGSTLVATMIPNGQVMMVDSNFANPFIYTPIGGPNAAWLPTITSIVNTGGLNYTLTGTKLSGISEGAYYGDDWRPSTNYPIVKLTDTSGNVVYAKTTNWSQLGVDFSNTSQTVNFTIPGMFNISGAMVKVIANGIASASFSLIPASPITWNKFQNFVQDLGRGVHNLNTDQIRIMFTNVAPLPTAKVKADITEITAAGGYPAGGPILTGQSYTQTNGTGNFTAANVVFVATGTVPTFRYLVLYNITPPGGALIAWADYGSPINMGGSQNMTIDLTTNSPIFHFDFLGSG